MSKRRRTVFAILSALTLTAALSGAPAPAGEWLAMSRPPFRILYQKGNGTEARILSEQAPQILSDLERDLGLRAPESILVRILPPARASGGDDQGPPGWAVGFVPGGSSEVNLRGDLVATYPFEDLLSLFGHELTHVLMNSLPPRSGPLPRWFNEGVAVMESRRWSLRDVFALGTTLLVGPSPRLAELSGDFPPGESGARAAYAQSFSFIAYLERERPGAVRRILAESAAGAGFAEAFRKGAGRSLGEMEAGWRDQVNFAYRWVPAVTSTGVLWAGITLLVLLGRIAKRRRERAIQEAWERQGLG
jgi:hypothetical protein